MNYITSNKRLATYLRWKGYQFVLTVNSEITTPSFVMVNFNFQDVPESVIRDYFHDTPEVILFKNIIAVRDLMNKSIDQLRRDSRNFDPFDDDLAEDDPTEDIDDVPIGIEIG